MKHVLLLVLTLFFMSVPQLQAATIIDIAFPLEGETTYTNDFYDLRGGGRYHYATDLMAPKMTPVLAAHDGVVAFAPTNQPSYGFMITLEGDDGYTYNYVHLNNDTPGTDDGQGGAAHAYAPGINQGVRVERGQHLGWVGDSGNAESVGSHLHFEIYQGSTPVDPYESLLAAEAREHSLTTTGDTQALSYDPVDELVAAVSISVDKRLDTNNETLCEPNSLIRTVEVSTVYYCGTDGGRYVFQNESTFFSWYDNFDDVEYISAEAMADIPLSGNVTYKPGSYMIKILSSPKVYAVGQGGTLHWIESAEMAEALYSEDWTTFVRDIPDGFWGAYDVGDDVTWQ